MSVDLERIDDTDEDEDEEDDGMEESEDGAL